MLMVLVGHRGLGADLASASGHRSARTASYLLDTAVHAKTADAMSQGFPGSCYLLTGAARPAYSPPSWWLEPG